MCVDCVMETMVKGYGGGLQMQRSRNNSSSSRDK